jgi:hypothetical protein
MCNVVFLSTTSAEDLSREGDGLFHIRPIPDQEPEEIVNLLRHPHRWYLECRYGGCSCHFRYTQIVEPKGRSHVAVDPAFGEPEDWSPEDDDDIESTAAFYDLLSKLVARGESVDLVAAWEGTEASDLRSIDVSLSAVPRPAFRFFDGYRFNLLP